MRKSPFSITHDWQLSWTHVPEHIEPHQYVNNESSKEQQALHFLSAAGVIGGIQLSRLFDLEKKRKRKMEKEKKIVRHTLIKNKQEIPIYTLGVNGAKAIGSTGYVHNQWKRLSIEKVLGRFMLVQLYEQFPGARITKAKDPFDGTLFLHKRPIYVYSVQHSTDSLLDLLKWGDFHERIIVIAENVNDVESLLKYRELKIRVVLAGELHQKGKGTVDFYINSGDRWIQESKVEKEMMVRG